MATNFGKDISCTDGLKTGRFATGARLVGEAIYRRLTTPRGMLRGGEDESDYGIELVELIGSVSSQNDAAALEGRIEAEIRKDERVISVSVVVVATAVGPAVEFLISIKAQTAEGPFNLQIGISDLTVELVGLSVEGAQ